MKRKINNRKNGVFTFSKRVGGQYAASRNYAELILAADRKSWVGK